MSDQKVPTAPDYSPMIGTYNGIVSHSQSQGQDALAWAKDQVANNQNLTDHVTKGLLDLQGNFTDAAGKSLASSQALQNDATNYLTSQRSRYSDPNYVANDMGAAEANVGQAVDAARNSHIQQLESFGVNPGATRFGALNIATNMQAAAAKASAGTGAARNDQAMADQANAALLGQGNTEAGQANQNAGTAAGAGTGAASTGFGQTASGANVLGTDLAWTGAASGAVGGAVNAQNTGFSNQAKSDEVSNSSSSGLGSLLGIGASMLGKGGAFASGGALAMLEEGGTVPGGAIPDSASPSGGAIVDDVPATAPGAPPIRLNGGEFVIPRDVAAWEGEKGLQALIQKARAAMQKAQAKPEMKSPAQAAQPQPQQGAIPTGSGGPGMAYAGGGAIPTPRERPRFADFRRSDNIEDRRNGQAPGAVPDYPDIPADNRAQGLTAEMGGHDIDRSIGEAMLRDLMPDQKRFGWPGPGETVRDTMLNGAVR
jgi:hypothetical protein